jgi:hypothetical protein
MKTMGIVLVAFLAARISLNEVARITSTLRRTNSSAKEIGQPSLLRTEPQKLRSYLQYSRAAGVSRRNNSRPLVQQGGVGGDSSI